MAVNTHGAIARIIREIAAVHKNGDLSLAVASKDDNVRLVRALIIGPPGTPYEYGFFEFNLKFPSDYPNSPPTVACVTTHGGHARFNPNIYADGKVCLSILGTWRGEPGEEWSSAQGLESLLLSIQSLMSAYPYENEPGFEHFSRDNPHGIAYRAKIRHQTLNIAVIRRLLLILQAESRLSDPHPESVLDASEPPRKRLKDASYLSPTEDDDNENDDDDNENDDDDAAQAMQAAYADDYDAKAAMRAIERSINKARWDPFAELIKQRFLWYYDAYSRSIDEHEIEHKDGERFKVAEFESPDNGMFGCFEYPLLRKRLDSIMVTLEGETRFWQNDGVEQVEQNSASAMRLAFDFKKLSQAWHSSLRMGVRSEIDLVDRKNPFVWRLTIFGDSVTNLDGGIFNVLLYIPPNFPDASPRAIMETKIFHRQVTPRGFVCYIPDKPDQIASHLTAIIEAIADVDPSYDPRAMVHVEAFELYWGGEASRKLYNRKLRRSAQDSSEMV